MKHGKDRRISKMELCSIFGLYRTSRPYYGQLRDKYFHDTALEKIGITREEYEGAKRFDALTSMKIIEIYNISDEELEEHT